MSSGGSDSATTFFNNQPWATQQPYLASGFAGAQNLLNNGIPAYYPNSTVADLSTYRQPALNAQWQVGSEGTPEMAALSQAGQGLLSGGLRGMPGFNPLMRTARGDFLTQQNPYFNQVVNQSIQAARPSIDAAFASTGRLGSGAHANAFADAATRIGAELGYQDYGRERGMQMQAASMLPGLQMQAQGLGGQFAQAANADPFQRLGLLNNVADFSDTDNQRLLDADIQRWNYGQTAPWDFLQRYMGIVGGQQWGGSGQQTQQMPAGNQTMQWLALASML